MCVISWQRGIASECGASRPVLYNISSLHLSHIPRADPAGGALPQDTTGADQATCNTRQPPALAIEEPALAAVSAVADNSAENNVPAADSTAADADSSAAELHEDNEAAVEAARKKANAKVRNFDHCSK